MTYAYADALALAIEAARAAAAILRQDFHRAGGPRGGGRHADADDEAQLAIAARLLPYDESWGWRGEEPEPPYRAPTDAPAHLWLIDPNDGTDSYLRGLRGSSVSIALLREGMPVLGVVLASVAPDDDGDLFAWAEGCGPLTRNGKPVARIPWSTALTPTTVVLLSDLADGRTALNAARVAPARFAAMPSIAYRLALVATGEAELGLSRSGPTGWDFAGGHALLRGVGGAFVDFRGREVIYDAMNGDSYVKTCYGGAPALVPAFATRPWEAATERHANSPLLPGQYDLTKLETGRNIADAGLLSRAQGCLLGQLAGDSLGSLVEFRSAASITKQYPHGVRDLADGGTYGTIAGQPTDDSELALALARSIVATAGYDREAAARSYVRWYHSGPFDVGGTISQACQSPTDSDVLAGRAADRCALAASTSSHSNGALMRISPLAIWGQALPAEDLAAAARSDAGLTHAHPVCLDASAVYTVAVARAIARGPVPRELYEWTVAWSEANSVRPEVLSALRNAETGLPEDFVTHQGWVMIAFQAAFYWLLHASSLAEGVVETVGAGGDTDTNAAIVGALLGAAHGRDAIPLQWRRSLASCRPLPGLPGVTHPRPREYWPVDAMVLAERLLLAGV